MSSAPVGNASLSKFDVLVIGSGAGGGAVTHMLCKLGQKVLVLEAGANRFDGLDDPTRQPVARFSNDELKLSNRDFIAPFVSVDPRTWRASESDRSRLSDVNSLPKTVGGGAVHADLKSPRFRPTDFQLGTLLGSTFAGASFADWPVDYDMLEPFYYYAEKVMGVQGVAGLDPLEGPRPSGDFPMPPGVPMYVGLKVSAGARTLGYHPFPYPTAVNSQPYDGRPACVDCGFCSGYGCPSNAKGSPPVTTLRKALLSGNCQLIPETRAVKLTLSGDKTQVTGVEAIGPDGKRRTYTADRYVLAASPIEDARLLFLSDPAGVGNSSGQVGRNLTFHFQTGAVGIFDERVHGHRGRTVSHGLADFRGVPGDAQRPLGGIVEISGSEFPIEEASRYLDIFSLVGGFTGKLFKKLLRQSAGRDHIVALALQAGRAAADQPHRSRSAGARSRRAAGRARHLPEPRLRAVRARLLFAQADRSAGRLRRALRVHRAGRRHPALAAHHGHAALRRRSDHQRVRPRRPLIPRQRRAPRHVRHGRAPLA